MSKPWITEPRDRRSKRYRATHSALRSELGKPIPQSENALHAAVVEYLTYALPKGAVFWHTPNEGKRGWAAQRALKWNATLKGFPDLCILCHGDLLAIELKAKGKKPTPDQRACMDRLRDAGAWIFVCYSVDEVAASLTVAGIGPIRSTSAARKLRLPSDKSGSTVAEPIDG